MKMLPKDYENAKGEPFRVEDYRGAKLEMYYLDDRADYAKFAQRGRFSVWTSNGKDYRLFVDKGYYAAVENLYQNEVNEIWLDFTNSIYGEQKKLSSKYMLVSFISMILILAGSFLVQNIFPDQANTILMISAILLFGGLFVSTNMQQKKLRTIVERENIEATNKIKNAIGEEAFQAILDGQEKYYKEYFAVGEDVELEEESSELLETEEEVTEQNEDNK